MRKYIFLSAIGLCLICSLGAVGCGDEKPGDVEEAERKLEEARRQFEQAKLDVENAKSSAERNVSTETGFVAPGDHLEPFDQAFGFGDANRVAHFWRWNHEWSFSEEQARNNKWHNHTFIASRYKLVGDFSVEIEGALGKSFTNSKRPHLHICGQEIKLTNTWKWSELEVTALRVGNELSYTIAGQEPVVVPLTDEQAGPTEVLLRFHNRHTVIRKFNMVAESADRFEPSESSS